MNEASMNPPSYEKVVMDSDGPLILRPPVGSAVYSNSKFSLNPIFSEQHPRRRRSGLIYLFVFLLILLAIAGVLMILFLFGMGPLAYAYTKHDRFHQRQHQSICRIRIPFLKIDPIESVSADESSLNVSISSLPTYNVIRILHSFEDQLTVIRTNQHCYIRPIRADLISESAADYVKRLNQGTDLQESVNGRVFVEPWFVDQSAPSPLYSSLVTAWCTGVPVYRLVSQAPAGGYQIDNTPQETDAESPFHDSFESDDDDAFDLLNGARVKFDKPIGGRFRRNIDLASVMNLEPKNMPIAASQAGDRNRRNIDLASVMGVKPDALPISAQDARVHCSIVDDILEDAPIPSQHQSNQVPIIRDVIMKCKSK